MGWKKENWTAQDYTELLQYLRESSESKFQQFQQRLIPVSYTHLVKFVGMGEFKGKKSFFIFLPGGSRYKRKSFFRLNELLQ